MGTSYVVNLVDAEPTEEQLALFREIIRTMQDLPAEFAVFEFQNSRNKPGEQQGLVFYQLCREEEQIRAEVRIDGPEEWRMYGIIFSVEEAVKLLGTLIATREAPDLAGWTDITESVRRGPEDWEFE